jgi:hypothetical protein
MIIPLRIHQRAFDQIRKNGAQQACAAVIFVSNECDSLSALKIVTVRILFWQFAVSLLV